MFVGCSQKAIPRPGFLSSTLARTQRLDLGGTPVSACAWLSQGGERRDRADPRVCCGEEVSSGCAAEGDLSGLSASDLSCQM